MTAPSTVSIKSSGESTTRAEKERIRKLEAERKEEERIQKEKEAAEKAEADIDLWLETHYTQADMNDAAQQKYQVWDDALNQLWADLKGLLGEEEMRELTNEELAWIREKEAAALEAAAEYEGGSIYPAVYSGTLTSLTKQRVYELLEYLPDSQ